MQPVVVSDVLAVGEVPTAEQLAILAKAGFKSVVNNQPDGEVAGFVPSGTLRAEAERRGLSYRYIPLESRTPAESDLVAFAAALKELPAPIYAFCYSGSRSAAACALVLAREKDAGEIITSFAAAGFDVTALRPWLESYRPAKTGAATSATVVPTLAPTIVVAPAVASGTGPEGARPAESVANGAHPGTGAKDNGAHVLPVVKVAAPTLRIPDPPKPVAVARPAGEPRGYTPIIIMPRAASFSGSGHAM